MCSSCPAVASVRQRGDRDRARRATGRRRSAGAPHPARAAASGSSGPPRESGGDALDRTEQLGLLADRRRGRPGVARARSPTTVAASSVRAGKSAVSSSAASERYGSRTADTASAAHPGRLTSGAAATAWRTASRAGCRNGSGHGPRERASGSRRWPNCRSPISASRSSATSAVRGSEAIVTRTVGSASPARRAAGARGRSSPGARARPARGALDRRTDLAEIQTRAAVRARGRTPGAATGRGSRRRSGAAARSAPARPSTRGEVEAREALVDDELEHRHLGVHQRAHGAVAALQAQVARVEPLRSRRRRRSARRSASRRRRRAAPPSGPRHPGRT